MNALVHIFCLISLLSISTPSWAIEVTDPIRQPYHPYITGDGFRAYADYIYDETDACLRGEDVHTGAIVFVKTDKLHDFFTSVHPKISNQYILVSHNSADIISDEFLPYLDDERIAVWFAKNVMCFHEKLRPLPIGLENRTSPRGDLCIYGEVKEEMGEPERVAKLYVNFKNHYGRKKVFLALKRNRMLGRLNSMLVVDAKGHAEYLRDLCKCWFVVSPFGYGPDCHRTWDALYMGSIPIILTSPMDSIYDDLPVIIVKSWGHLSDRFLSREFEKLQNVTFNMEKLNIQYWFDQIEMYRKLIAGE